MTCSDLYMEKGFAGEPVDHCLVIDAHGHWGWENSNFPFLDASVEATLATMDRLGVDVFCASSISACYGPAAVGNDIVAEAIRQCPERLFGYMNGDIRDRAGIAGELERRHREGFRGVKIHSFAAPYSHPNYDVIFAFANERKLPLLAHTWGDAGGELDLLLPAIEKYPDIHWLLAHAGACDVDKYIRLAAEHPSVFLETALSVAPRGLYKRFLEGGVIDKVMWGSDMHFMDPAQQIGRVLFAGIPPEAKEKVLGLNAKRALRL